MRMILLRHALRCHPRLALARTMRLPPLHLRYLSSTVPATEPDWVRSAIQKMMEEHAASADDAPHEAPRDLQKALLSLQNQLQEAESCVQDCRDCPATELSHELATADRAIDQAVQRLLDVLEGSRTTPMPTEEWVQRIKQLRAQVKQLQPSSEPSANVVTNTTTTAP